MDAEQGESQEEKFHRLTQTVTEAKRLHREAQNIALTARGTENRAQAKLRDAEKDLVEYLITTYPTIADDIAKKVRGR